LVEEIEEAPSAISDSNVEISNGKNQNLGKKVNTSIYVYELQWNLFKYNSKRLHGKSPNERLQNFILAENNQDEGKNPDPDKIDSEEPLRMERLKILKLEDALFKTLSIPCGRKTAFEALVDFAVRNFHTDRQLCVNIDKALEELKCYVPRADDPFSPSSLESFIEFLDYVLRRRKIEAQLTRLRRKEQAKKSS